MSISTSVPESLLQILATQANVSQEELTNALDVTLQNLTKKAFVPLADAFELSVQYAREDASASHVARNKLYFDDFVAYMQENYAKIVNANEVTANHARDYFKYLRTHGAFISTVVQHRQSNNKKKRIKVITFESKHELSTRTINARMSAIRTVFKRILEEAKLTHNPFNIPLLHKKTENREAFTQNEIRLMLEHATMPITKPLVITGLFTGLAMKDICMLKWTDIVNGFIIKPRCKTGAALEIPIMPTLQALIDEIRSQAPQTEYVFDELHSLYLHNPSAISCQFQTFLTSLNIETSVDVGIGKRRPKKTLHSLRHTFAYMLGIGGTPDSIVQSLMGHMTPEMTRHYQQHIRRVDKERFVKQFEEQITENLNKENTHE